MANGKHLFNFAAGIMKGYERKSLIPPPTTFNKSQLEGLKLDIATCLIMRRRDTIPITDGGESMSSSGANNPTIPAFFSRRQGHQHDHPIQASSNNIRGQGHRHDHPIQASSNNIRWQGHQHDHPIQASSNNILASSNNYDWNRPSNVPRPLIRQSDEGGGMQERPWWLFEERVRTGPYGLSRFPSQPHSPSRILILDEDYAQVVNPGLHQFIRDSPPRVRVQWHMGPNPMEEEPGLTPQEFKKAKSKLIPYIFPRSGARTRGRFSRSHSNNTTSHPAAAAEDPDKGKECTICLDAFVPNDKVLITPCNHMFHNECLLPWVQSHGNCPVCRFALVERRRNAISTYNGNNIINRNDDAMDTFALIMAMEEAFRWINGGR